MKDALKFVTPAFKAGPAYFEGPDHYIIRDGRVTAFSRALAMSAPLPDVPDCCPRADLFRAAVDKGGDAIGFDLGPATLQVRAKGLRVAVPCLADRPYEPLPYGDPHDTPEGFLEALRRVEPFLGTDDARPWGKAAWTNHGCLSATNNISIIQTWTGHSLPAFGIPDIAMTAILREKKPPISIWVSSTDVTFWYEGDRWIKAQFYEGEFPFDTVMRLMDKHGKAATDPIPEGLKEAIERIEPFCEKDRPKLYFRDNGIATHQERSTGAHIEFPGLPDRLGFSLMNIQNMLTVAQTVRWSEDKQHDFFTTDGHTRGAIMGLSW